MYKITSEELSTEILDQFIPSNIKLRDKLIRKCNEMYQFNAETYNSVLKEDYSFIQFLLDSHVFHYC